jgi:hypothetical protein
MTQKTIVRSEFTKQVVDNRLTKAELAAMYELPKTEITKLLKAFGLRISPKRYATYSIVDDTVAETNVATTTDDDLQVVNTFDTTEENL